MTTITQYLEAEVPDTDTGTCRIIPGPHGYGLLYTPSEVTL